MAKLDELPGPLKALLAGAAGQVAVDPDQMVAVCKRYADCLSSGDVNGVVSLYAPDATLQDPVFTPALRGADQIRGFYKGAFDAMGGFIDLRLDGSVRVAGNVATALYVAVTTMEGVHIRIDTVDIFTFNAAGLITSTMAYWGPKNVSRSAAAPQRRG